jgi:hypothetical protein
MVKSVMVIETKRYALLIALLFLAACGATETVTPLGNNKFRIDVSAPASYSRAEAQQIANKQAAQATLEHGYDRFVILSSKLWTEREVYSDTYRTYPHKRYNRRDPFYDDFDVTRSVSVVNYPEAKMIVRMLKDGDKGASEAVDARAYLTTLEKSNQHK